MWQFTTDEKKYECAYIDGYLVGERLLEGVMFEIRIVGKKFKAKVIDQYKEYFETLNTKKWLKAVESYCAQNDMFSTAAENGEDCWVIDDKGNAQPHLKNIVKPKPVKMQVSSFADIIKNIQKSK